MNEKIFDIWLDAKDGHTYTLTLPATDYTLLDTLERLGLDPGEQPKWSFYRVNGFESLKPHIRHDESLYALNALMRRLSALGPGQRMVFEGIINIEHEKGRTMTLDTMADVAFSICCGHAAHAPALPRTPPEKPGYVFRISLDNREGSIHAELELPAAQEKLDAALEGLGARSWDEVVLQGKDSAIPGFLDHMEFLFDGIDQLNELAGVIQRVDAAGQLTKFKAVLKAMDLTEPDDAIDLEARLDEYILSPELRTPTDVAIDRLRASVDKATLEELLPRLDCNEYGNAVLKKYGEALTEYGLVNRRDGQPLHTQTIQQGGMEMG